MSNAVLELPYHGFLRPRFRTKLLVGESMVAGCAISYFRGEKTPREKTKKRHAKKRKDEKTHAKKRKDEKAPYEKTTGRNNAMQKDEKTKF